MIKIRRVQLEVLPSQGEWHVTRDGDVVGKCQTQAEAIRLAVLLARAQVKDGRTASLKIKRPNGKIRDERTYPRSSDPRRTKG